MKILLAFYTLSSIQKCPAQPMRFLQYGEERNPGNVLNGKKKKKRVATYLKRKALLKLIWIQLRNGAYNIATIVYSCTIQQ